MVTLAGYLPRQSGTLHQAAVQEALHTGKANVDCIFDELRVLVVAGPGPVAVRIFHSRNGGGVLWYWRTGSRTTDLAARDQDDAGLLGVRVAVLTDFIDGIGHVQLNGAKWDAESNESLKAGDTAWVLNHSGIVLQVSAQRPEKS